MSSFTLETPHVGVELHSDGSWTLWDKRLHSRLIIAPTAPLSAPRLPAGAVWRFTEVDTGADNITWHFQACDQGTSLGSLTATLSLQSERLIISSSFVPVEDFSLSSLDVFPPTTGLNLFDLVNFRNHHYSTLTWPNVPVGGGHRKTSTYSDDWQFAPHPSAVVFRKDQLNLLLGALDLSPSFGLHIELNESRVLECAVDFGAEPHSFLLPAGQPYLAPRFVLLDKTTSDVHESFAAYCQTLVDFGSIPNPAEKERFDWHTEPLYFTWMDQAGQADSLPSDDLAEQAAEMASADDHAILQVLNTEFVLEVARTIRRENLPIRSILIDDGWQITRGQWDPHQERFPDLRGLVDQLHAMDFKVLFWWSWAEITDQAEVAPAHLLVNPDGTSWRNRHGSRVRDYSHPATQAYLREFFQRMCSSDPGCFNFDGVKTDFLADKVHAEMPIHDVAWRGEENYMLRVTRTFMEAMRAAKPDACHVGCAGHPHLAELIDINRTYDVFSAEPVEHLNRAKMLHATCPGVPVAFDSHNFIDGLDRYLALAKESGCSVQLSNILWQRQDILAPFEPAGPTLYEIQRSGLGRTN